MPALLTPLVDFAGVALGVLLALLLVSSLRGNRAANRWLAAYVAVLAMLSFGDLAEDVRWVLRWPHLAHLTDWLIFLVGPLLLMYVRRLTMRANPTIQQFLWHALPALLCLLLLFGFFLQPTDTKQRQVAAELAAAPSLEPLLLLAAAQMLVYWIACLLSWRRFQRDLRARFASVENRGFSWLRSLLVINLVMWLMWVIGLVGQQSWVTWLDRVAIPAGLYLLAFLGARQFAVFVGRHAWVELPASKRYERSGLEPARVPAMRQRLDLVMATEKPWLESDLTLPELAARVQLSPHHLSQLLNAELGVSFFDFINGRRVQEVQRCLRDPAYRPQSILDIALAAGFNSKAAFNTAFKQHSGVTPSQYRRDPFAPAA
jgi:AraC-like DNA-binding protein